MAEKVSDMKLKVPPRPRQKTDRPGGRGSPKGPAHHEPLSKHSVRQTDYGPGTYGNDMFAAEHHDDFDDDRELPEGLQDPQAAVDRPTLRTKSKRYGRIGEHGKG